MLVVESKMKTLTKSENIKVLSDNEDLWVRFNNSDEGLFKIGKFIGRPNDAVICSDEKYAIIAGYGLMVVDLDGFINNINGLQKKSVKIYFRENGRNFWINKVWQDQTFESTTFCFQAQLKQYCFDVKKETLLEFGSDNIEIVKKI